MEHTIQFIVISIIMALVLLLARRRQVIVKKSGVIVLQYSTGVLIVVLLLVSLLPIGGSLFFLTKFGIKSNSDLIICVSWLTFFVIVGAYIFMRLLKERIVVDPVQIQAFYPFGESRTIRWVEIGSVKYSEVNRWIILESHEQKKIRISIMLTGFQEFCKIAKQNIPQLYAGDELEKASHATFLA